MNLNSTDFKVMVELMGWKKIPTYLMPYPSSEQHIFVLNGFTMYFRNYYAIVNGRMPILKAKELFDTYDNEKYQIRVEGNSEYSKPDDFKRHARVNEYCCNPRNLFNPLDSEDVCEEKIRKFKEFKSRVEQEDPDRFYVGSYHIDTIEGLKVFTNFIKENNIRSKWWDGVSE